MEKEEKLIQIHSLLFELDDPLLQYFDAESEELLDEKIEVLTALKEGKSIAEIPKFYEVLELLPNDSVENGKVTITHWD